MKWYKDESYITFSAEGLTISYPCYPYADHVWTVREAWKAFSSRLRTRGIRYGQYRITFTTDSKL